MITADNPRAMEEKSDPEQWRAEQSLLRDAMKTLGIRYSELSSGRGEHLEHSFGFGNVEQADVLELAHQFGQLAVFRLEADTQQVVDTDGVVRRSIPRRR